MKRRVQNFIDYIARVIYVFKNETDHKGLIKSILTGFIIQATDELIYNQEFNVGRVIFGTIRNSCVFEVANYVFTEAEETENNISDSYQKYV